MHEANLLALRLREINDELSTFPASKRASRIMQDEDDENVKSLIELCRRFMYNTFRWGGA
ncbi:MAG: hypothetical protein LBQ16_04805 [Gracilibacteraceae bacterium]|jgi:hypothetical protein|nr:hypothetical protein [Gracilibacteraceae bacterium]